MQFNATHVPELVLCEVGELNNTFQTIQYNNKDILSAAGLLDCNGQPKGLNSFEGFTQTLRTLKESGAIKFPLGSTTDDGNFMFRTIISFMGQLGGELITDGEFLVGYSAQKLTNALTVLQDWTNEELQSTYTDYPSTVALFTSGEAAMVINGVWDVPTMLDLHKDGKLLDWGVVGIPVVFDKPASYSDSHFFAIPAGKELQPEKRSAVLKVIKWISDNSLFWATAGHIPAYKPITQTSEYKSTEPNAIYPSVTESMIYDPKTPLAGVAGPIFDIMSTYFVPTLICILDDGIELEIPKNLVIIIKEIGIRPEAVSISQDEEDLRGHATVVEHLGDRTIVYVQLQSGTQITAQDSGRSTVQPNDLVNLELSADQIHFFDESGKAVF